MIAVSISGTIFHIFRSSGRLVSRHSCNNDALTSPFLHIHNNGKRCSKCSETRFEFEIRNGIFEECSENYSRNAGQRQRNAGAIINQSFSVVRKKTSNRTHKIHEENRSDENARFYVHEGNNRWHNKISSPSSRQRANG